MIEDDVQELYKYANIAAESQRCHNEKQANVYNHQNGDQGHIYLKFCNSKNVL